MPKPLYRSSLTAAKKEALLTKIAALVAEKKSRLVVDKGKKRYVGKDFSSVTITPASATGTLVFDDGSGAQTYDLADIIEIKRLRARKWKITLKFDADSAA